MQGVAGFTYQFRPDAMFGASGTIAQLHYPNLSEVPGLYNSDEYMSQGFYTHRFVGTPLLRSQLRVPKVDGSPDWHGNESHTGLLFYTLMQSAVSVSVFGGAQHSNSSGGTLLPVRVWTPVIGGSVNWHGGHTSFGLTVSRASSRRLWILRCYQSTRLRALLFAVNFLQHLTAGISAQYSTSRVLNPVPGSSTGGHGISGTVSFSHAPWRTCGHGIRLYAIAPKL